jgi:ribose transport system permease protein
MKFKAKKLIEYMAMLGIWLGLVLLFGLLSDNFLSTRTFVTLANRIPALAVIATGMTLVLIIGGIDLSVGSVLGLCGAVVGLALVNFHLPFWLAILLGLGTGLAAGTLNGVVSVGLGIPSFIVTLGMLEIARGLAYLTTNSQTKYIGNAVEGIARPVAGMAVSPAFLIALVVIVIGQVVLSRTVFGRYLVAIGTNEQAVRLAGINPKPAKIAVYALLGLLTGLSGVFYTSRLGSSDPNAGVGLELSAIAAVVIGGTSLMGGRGSVVNTFFGVLIIATLEAGLAQVGASEPTKRVITGLVIVGAVVLDAWRHHLTGKRFLLLKHLFSWTPSPTPPNHSQQVVERERVRIARDIHDEIGANLTQIALLSELAKSDLAKPERAKGHMDEVFRTAQSLTRSLDEIVWAVNPAGDTLEQFATHLCTFAPRFLQSAGVRCRLDVPDELPAITLPASVRHHLHLGVKESLNNIAKHAQATEVWLRMKLSSDKISLILEDNGRGFELGSDTNPGADGLANLRQRMKEIGGSFEQQSQSGRGTITTLTAPLRNDD